MTSDAPPPAADDEHTASAAAAQRTASEWNADFNDPFWRALQDDADAALSAQLQHRDGQPQRAPDSNLPC